MCIHKKQSTQLCPYQMGNDEEDTCFWRHVLLILTTKVVGENTPRSWILSSSRPRSMRIFIYSIWQRFVSLRLLLANDALNIGDCWNCMTNASGSNNLCTAGPFDFVRKSPLLSIANHSPHDTWHTAPRGRVGWERNSQFLDETELPALRT